MEFGLQCLTRPQIQVHRLLGPGPGLRIKIMEFGLQWVHIISSPSCSHSPFMFAFTWLTAFDLAVFTLPPFGLHLAEYPTAEKMQDQGKTSRVELKRDASQGDAPEIPWWMRTQELRKRTMCSFHKSSMCNKGEYCLYAHTRKEKGELPKPWVVIHLAENRKTELCKGGASCPRQDCQYAHSQRELGKEKPKRLKTKLCIQFTREEGCPFGRYCQFAHSDRELGNEVLEWKMKLCETWKQAKSCKVPNCPDAHGVERIGQAIQAASTRNRTTDRGKGRRSRSPKVLPIIIQSCSLFPVHSNPSAT